MMQAQFVAAPVAPRVTVLDVRRQSMKNYNYLVVDPATMQAVIVDPAWELEKLDAAVAESRASLAGVLVTHSHRDHIDLAAAMSEKYRCPVWMPAAEIAASGFDTPRLQAIATTPWVVGAMRIEPIFTPGHTPGSTCYLIGENLFTGDVLFAEGCGLCPDLEAAYAMFESLERIKSRTGPHIRVFPGHSYGQPPGRPMSQLMRENIYLQFSSRESFAAFRMRSGQDRARLFNFS
ncbi:MAG TPA: MBL fold metallo-hydrolase [Thermoanaerobaculia bacterium]|jgi:hydroxyacylglutathione hydrolase